MESATKSPSFSSSTSKSSKLGWLASLGVAGVLVGCAPMAPDAEGNVATEDGYSLTATNGLIAINGLTSTNGLTATNGLTSTNGLTATNGLTSTNGLSSTSGLMTSSAGRDTVKYLVRCALASGDSLVKADNYGTNYTYPGMFGLATQYKTGACDVACQQAISACMLAHVNTTGANIPLYLVSSNAKIGWGTSQQYPSREGTFFGNIFTAPNAFYCLGPDFDVNVVPGRLGSNSSGSPYKNPYGTNAQCGSCTTDPAHPEAPTTCATGGVTYASPVTVYRGRIFEAENAVVYPTTAGPANITCATNGCSSGKRVGYISGDSYVQLNNVYSQSGGTMNVMLYYTNGSTNDRFYRIWLNGKQVATIGFPPTGNNDTFKSYKVVGISGFLAGSNNTLKLQGPGTTASDTNAPDLDFVEVQ